MERHIYSICQMSFQSKEILLDDEKSYAVYTTVSCVMYWYVNMHIYMLAIKPFVDIVVRKIF
jgi:hypothetical protein